VRGHGARKQYIYYAGGWQFTQLILQSYKYVPGSTVFAIITAAATEAVIPNGYDHLCQNKNLVYSHKNMPKFNILKFTSLSSTNQYALEHLAELNDRAVIVSEEQTGGRGRLDRRWLSPPGQNIYCSIVLKNLTDKPALLTILAALAAAETLRSHAVPAGLKWPNDVLVKDKKICGILAEANTQGLVLGLGLNVNMPAAMLAQIGQPATSLLAETARTFDREQLLNELLEKFFTFYEHILARGFAYIVKIWQNELHIIGKEVHIQTGQKEFRGVVTGIGEDGALIVETAQGPEKILAGDVHVVG
jgi:BirA family biotin operon repressor/biotin-[acetyl-CoA-carboxylase] ligase